MSLVELKEEVLFTAGLAATAWDESGVPIEWSEWSEEDLRKMAENDQHIRATNQPVPYINPAHFEDPVPGFVGPLRYIPGERPSAKAPKGRPGRIAARVTAEPWIAQQVASGRRPWRSVEITKHASAADYHGIEGPVLRGLALLNTHPRRKNLDSPVYAEVSCYQEPARAGSVFVTPYTEPKTMDIAKIMAALEALEGDSAKLAAVAEALGLTEQTAPVQEEVVPVMTEQEAPAVEEALAAMSEKLAAAEAVAASAQRQAESVTKREQEAQLSRFRDALVEGYGEARADAAMSSVRSRLLSVNDVFSDKGKAVVDQVFAETLVSMGEPVVGNMTQPLGRTAKTTKAPETFSDVARSVLAEATPAEEKILRNPAFSGALHYMTNKRLARS